jgi:hypothetical protein
MEAMRMNWTDGRLDDMSRRIDERFDRVEAEMNATRRELTARFDDLNRTLLQGSVGIIVALLGLAGVLVVQA